MSQSYTFGGQAIFGTACRSSAEANPRASQKNEYFGLNGYELLDGGSRGTRITVRGIISAPSGPGLITAWATSASYRDNVARPLVVADGTFPTAVMVEWHDESGIVAGVTGWYRRYRAEFESPI